MLETHNIIAEPYANGSRAVGRILFLADVGEFLGEGELLCVHAWHWPDDLELQELEPHLTFVEPGRHRVVATWRKRVGDIVHEGEVIGALQPTDSLEVATFDDSLTWSQKIKQRARQAAGRLAIQLGVDLSQVEATGEQGEITSRDVQSEWEKTVAAEHWPDANQSKLGG